MLSDLARFRRLFLLAVLACAVAVLVVTQLGSETAACGPRYEPHGPPGGAPASARWQSRGGTHWVASWGASAQAAIPGGRAELGFTDQTVRDIVFTSVGGSMVRVRFTNAFGTTPLKIGSAAIGVERSGAALTAGSCAALSFAGQPSVVIAPGSVALSDPVRLAVLPLEKLAVSVYLPSRTGPATQHLNAQEINYVATGAHALDTGGGAFTVSTGSWYFVDRVDVLSPPRVLGTVVALGDSITDGMNSPVNANARWPNDLARRFAALPGATLGVIDEGIGGNRVLNDSACCGVNAIARFGADVAAEPGARDVILLEGVNDIGFSQLTGPLTKPDTGVSADQIIAGLEAIISHAHAAGLKIFGATLTPFRGAKYWTPAGEAKREAVNRWIVGGGAFDGVIDFARAVADPSDVEALAPAYDSGDHLHPNGAGYLAMAGTVDLGMLVSGGGGA